MATSTLTFEKVGGVYAAKFASQGACVIEIERDEQSPVSVSANIDGMAEVPIASFNNPYVSSVIFNLDIPAGINITIKSTTEVVSAKMAI